MNELIRDYLKKYYMKNEGLNLDELLENYYLTNDKFRDNVLKSILCILLKTKYKDKEEMKKYIDKNIFIKTYRKIFKNYFIVEDIKEEIIYLIDIIDNKMIAIECKFDTGRYLDKTMYKKGTKIVNKNVKKQYALLTYIQEYNEYNDNDDYLMVRYQKTSDGSLFIYNIKQDTLNIITEENENDFGFLSYKIVGRHTLEKTEQGDFLVKFSNVKTIL